ncbi:hypothetical protein [Halopenitus persicus]|uniref:hypothetical protein n=1 Tax=Halopenitus persicus TaxID=1048396 RepID=UPI0012FD4713|nr:hypothetical protein [Halopenitus persicus]
MISASFDMCQPILIHIYPPLDETDRSTVAAGQSARLASETLTQLVGRTGFVVVDVDRIDPLGNIDPLGKRVSVSTPFVVVDVVVRCHNVVVRCHNVVVRCQSP